MASGACPTTTAGWRAASTVGTAVPLWQECQWCVMVVKARNKFSGDPIAFRSTFDGRRVNIYNAIDYPIAEEAGFDKV